MCYWFERTGDYVRCEVRRAGDEYELTVVKADGAHRVWRFTDSSALYRHQVAIEQRLLDRGWKGPHGRTV